MKTGQLQLDIIAAFENSRTAAATPIWELEFQIWDVVGKRPVRLGREFTALTPAEQERALHVNAETMAEVAVEMNFAAVTVPGNYWEIAPGEASYYWLPDEARMKQTEILAGMAGDRFLLVANTGGVMCMPAADNYVEFSYKLFDAPEDVDDLAAAILKAGIDKARRFRDLGVRVMCSPSDLADNSGVFFSPEQMQRHILPYLAKWTEEVRTLGAYSILHSDGNLYPCLESLADSGLDALQAIDPVAGMDMDEVRARIGNRLCLCGNVDCGLLLTGTPEDVYLATRALLESRADDERFILGASNAVQRETPEANYRAMIEAWKNHGGKHYTNNHKSGQ